MPLYFFHLRNAGDRLLDDEGTCLPGPEAVAPAALREARAIISADALTGRIDLAQRIEVEDSQGRLVHRLALDEAVTIVGRA